MKALIILAMSFSLASCVRETKSLKIYELPEPSTHKGRTAPEGTVPYVSKTTLKNKQLLPGKELYQIHCQICHGPQGTGKHQLDKYGLPTPPSFHLEAVKMKPVSFFTSVMKDGRGAMVSYKGRLTSKEREEVAKYIKSLQESGEKE